MLIIGTEPTMDAQASEQMVSGLSYRLEKLAQRVSLQGKDLTPNQVDKIHAMVDSIHRIVADSVQRDPTLEGTMTEAAKAIRERIERDQ